MSLIRRGVTRLREELEAAAARPVREITAESEGPGNAASGVYVGTEALLHRLDSADVVAFLDFDNEISAPTYRAGEHAWALLVLASRLLRGAKDPVIVLQVNDSEDPVVARFAHPDPARIVASETTTRLALGLPPFASLARVDGDESVQAVLDKAPLGIDVAAVGEGRWLVRGVDAETFADFCAVLRRAQVRVHVDPQRY
jgi:primosomal protein N' (replication factor Y)